MEDGFNAAPTGGQWRRDARECDREQFHNGRIYIGSPDQLIKKDRVLVTKGARENRYRRYFVWLLTSMGLAW